jgi:hypothetical protein
MSFTLSGWDNRSSKSPGKGMKLLRISTAHNHLNRRKTLLALMIITLITPLLGTTFLFNTNVDDKIVSADGVFYDFINEASTASWGSGAGSLPFPGKDNDSRGFALYRNNWQLEDSSTWAKVLETHPQWVSDGWIMGRYPQLTVPSGAELKVTVGFLKGATGTDGVTFKVQFEEGQSRQEILSLQATYDGKLDSMTESLSSLSGRTGYFILYVNAGQGSGQDWAAWAEAKIEVAAPPAALPDLIVEDVWQVNNTIRYKIKNVGEGSVVNPLGGTTPFCNALFIDGELVAKDYANIPEMLPGQYIDNPFDYYWEMTLTQHTIKVCADWEQNIDEENEQNNCLEQEIGPPEKDTTPPIVTIVHSPANVSLVSNVTFTVVATDDTNVTRIVIYVNETVVFECEPPEYFWKDNFWQCICVGGPYPVGTLNYSAAAYDTEGNKGGTDEKTINVTSVEWKPPPAELVLPCYVSGRLYNFTYYSKTLRVQICEAEVIGGGCSPDPPFLCTEPIITCKPDGAVWYENVTRLWAGEERYGIPGPMEYRMQVSCNGTYLIRPVFQPFGDECEWQGTWIPSKANFVVMNGTSQEGYDFTFRPVERTAPAITEVSYPENLNGLDLSSCWGTPREFVEIRAFDASGIQRIKVNGNLTAIGFISDESGPLLILDYPNPDRTTFFNISQECNGSPCVVNFSGFCANYPEFTKISLDFHVSVCDGAGNSVSNSYHKTYTPEGDLEIVSVEPVQVVYGAPLVKGKNTAFRVKVNSTFYYPIETKFGLILPDTQWYKWPSAGGVNFTMPPDWSYPEIWGPIKIPARARNYEVILPIVPEWETRMGFGAHSPVGVTYTGVIPGAERGGVFWPDTRVMPRPIADSVSFSVEIDPNNEVEETNEGNNGMVSSDYEVITTRGYTFAVFRVLGGEEDPTCTPSFDGVHQAFKENFDYLVGTYPIADNKISFSIMPNPDITYDTTEEERADFLRRIYRMVRSDYDWAVGVTCGCCGGTCMYDYTGWDTHAVLIGNNTSNIHNLAHEVNHVLMGAPDCYGCGDPDALADCNQCRADEGLWVNAWQRYPTNATEAWLHGCYIMDFSNYAPHCWMRLNPVGKDDGGSFNDGYLNMIDKLTSSDDPEGLLVSGEIYRNNTVILDPFIRLSNVTLDIEPREEGEYYIVLLDSNDEPLSKSGFYAAFYETPNQPASEPVELDKAGFACVVEWEEGTNRIELQDKNGDVLASREVSPNAPEIEVLHPNGGEVWERGKTYKIKWEASDKDGDLLTYSLAISKNGAETWLPIDIDITDNEYELNTVALEEGQNYLVRVRVTDGVNTEEDVSDGVFTITTVEKAEINWWLIIGIVVGIAIIASALVIRSRKKA